MTTVTKTLVMALGLMLFAGPAMAGDDGESVASEVAEMRRLLQGLQERVEAQEEQLEAQGRQLDEAQSVVRRTQEDSEAVSGLASFLDSLEVEGWVAGSYAWNTNDPDDNFPANANPAAGGLNQGDTGTFYPFHGDHNSFEVDQVWFGIGKSVSEESRAGFRFDIVYGATATFLGNGSPNFSRGTTNDATNDFYVNQAYIEYLAPIANGVNVKFGKFGTLAGAEVAQTTQNFNITRGNLYNLFQPIDHVGILVGTEVGAGVTLTLGGANSQALGVGTLDDNKEKTLLSQAAWSNDMISVAATVMYGAEGGTNQNDLGLFDMVITADPSDNVSLWLNFDYLWNSTDQGSNPGDAWGIGAAGRVGLTDDLGFSVRGEYVADNRGLLGFSQVNDPNPSSVENWAWSLTGTIDYTLVEDLMVRVEARYDRSTSNNFFNGSGPGYLDRDQTVLLAEAIYTF